MTNNRYSFGSRIGLLLTFGAFLALGGCIKDRSMLPTEGPGSNLAVSLEIEGVENVDDGINVESFDKLMLSPTVTGGEGVNLEYRWTLSKSSDVNELGEEVIANTKDLDAVIERTESTAPYKLTFTVINKDMSDLELSTTWDLYVSGFIASGLVVADTKDGSKTDLSYIKSKAVSRAYEGEPKSKMHLLLPGNAPSSPATGLYYSAEGYIFSSHGNHLWMTTADGRLFRYDVKTFAPAAVSDDGNLFLYRPGGSIKVYTAVSAGQLFVAMTDAGAYSFVQKTKGNLSFSVPVSDASVDVSVPSNGLIAGQANNMASNRDVAMWFDESRGRFVTLTPVDSWGSVYGYGSILSSDAYDPNSLKGFEAKAVEYTKDQYATSYALLKKKDADEFYLFQAVMGKSATVKAEAQTKYSFTPKVTEVLSQGVSFVFEKSTTVLYVLTPQKIYAIPFGGSSTLLDTVTEVYSAPAGEEFTLGKLFVQAEYSVGSNYISLVKPKPGELPLNLKALLVASQKGAEGILRVIPIDQDKIGTGALLTGADQVSEFGGFDTILAVTSLGQ